MSEETLQIAEEGREVKSKRDDSTHGHHQMVNAEIRLIIFFGAKDGETI